MTIHHTGAQGPKGDKGDQSLSAKEWKTYLIGGMVTVLLATTGTVYGLTASRITKVENTLTAKQEEDKVMAVQLAELKTSLDNLTDNLGKLSEDQQRLVSKVDAVMSSILNDSRRWNEQMDKFERDQRAREAEERKK